ncbi:hypothetical protein [Chelativorans alearense]|uniref:hypothetical protein n=1 Tax=Chelativorans alearense TaxID=2681495 RepID=UPI001FEC0C02|nr:hypothetical protein [Chelativorans alearense]
MRHHIDADAKWPDLRHRLENLDLKTFFMQAKSRRQAANTGARDRDPDHRASSLVYYRADTSRHWKGIAVPVALIGILRLSGAKTIHTHDIK